MGLGFGGVEVDLEFLEHAICKASEPRLGVASDFSGLPFWCITVDGTLLPFMIGPSESRGSFCSELPLSSVSITNDLTASTVIWPQ